MKVPTILIIEDNHFVLKSLKLQLEQAGYITQTAEDGITGLAVLEAACPDLVLLDTMLPEMGGLEVCQRIRQQYPLDKLPIIMLSALGSNPHDRVQGLQAGANDYLAKPYHEDELLLKVRSMIQIKESMIQVESLLSQYMQPILRQQALLHPEFMERRQHADAIILMADLRGFTALTHRVEMTAVMKLLDEFFESMVRVITDHGGMVLDIVGDALLAVFNVPNPMPVPHQLAVQAALEMQSLFRLLQPQWAKADMQVGLGIGIDRGEVILGNLGSAGVMRYTVIGNAVNYASRLSDLAQDGGVLISAGVYEHIHLVPNIQLQPKPDTYLKGIADPQLVYYVLGSDAALG